MWLKPHFSPSQGVHSCGSRCISHTVPSKGEAEDLGREPVSSVVSRPGPSAYSLFSLRAHGLSLTRAEPTLSLMAWVRP